MKVQSIKGKGRGVFAHQAYKKGELVLSNEILVIPRAEMNTIENSFLNNYAFLIGGLFFLALGKGSLINHSEKPNLHFMFRKKTQQIAFYALKSIKAGEELSIDYEWDEYPWKKS